MKAFKLVNPSVRRSLAGAYQMIFERKTLFSEKRVSKYGCLTVYVNFSQKWSKCLHKYASAGENNTIVHVLSLGLNIYISRSGNQEDMSSNP
jgi:hypothetical protein